MSPYEYETQSLEELDAADRQQVEQAEEVILRVVAQRHPSTISELSQFVRGELGEDVDNSLIRAAILRLLNESRLDIGNGHQIVAAG